MGSYKHTNKWWRYDRKIKYENMLWGDACHSNAKRVVDGWYNSPAHRANMLARDITQIGFGALTVYKGCPCIIRQCGTMYERTGRTCVAVAMYADDEYY